MTVLFENERRTGKLRKSIVGAIVWAVGWFYWAMVMAHFFGALPGKLISQRIRSAPGTSRRLCSLSVSHRPSRLIVYSRAAT